MKTKHKIAAAMIANDGVLSGKGYTDFNRCLDSLRPFVEKVFVGFNGHASLDELREVYPDTDIIFKDIEWKDDFAEARNESFQMVRDYADLSGQEIGWILWIDTDDTLESADDYTIVELLDSLDPATQVVMLRYDYAVDPATGTTLAIQWRERLIRSDCNSNWWFPIHEVCRTPVGTQYTRREGVWIRHWREPKMEESSTRERNRRILTKALQLNPDEPRFKYYFANEVYAEAALAAHEGRPNAQELIDAAIKAYEEYIPDAPSPDDAYIAAHQVGELNRMKEDFLPAIESELTALMIHPDWPDAYIGIAQSYMHLQDWDKCEFWARACLNNSSKVQETTQVREPLNSDYVPRLLLGIALEAKGDLFGALEQFEVMATFNLTEEVQNKIDQINAKLSSDDPDVEEVDEVQALRNIRFGAQPEKSIAFFTAPLFEPWHPRIVSKGGIGGAETCVMEVAKRYAADGWRTVIFGTPGEYRGLDPETGVEYWNTEDFLIPEKFTVFVSSRIPQVFDGQVNADLKVLWMHDVNVGDNFGGEFGDRLKNVDYVIGLTDWHCQHLTRLYSVSPKKLVRIPNGVDLTRFKTDYVPDRQKYKFVWSSSPDRGLDVVLQLWPEIRRRWPEAELHVYYGWQSIRKILESYPNHIIKVFMEGVEEMIDSLGREEAGIYWHDRVDQDTLARELMTCHAWLYPTYFMETFCITAVEMQAAGVLPVTSSVAALKETVNPKALQTDGWPNNDNFKRQYLMNLTRTVDSSRMYQNSLRESGYVHAKQFTWDNAYEHYWKALTSEVVPVDPKPVAV